jgi:hypothetical protein
MYGLVVIRQSIFGTAMTILEIGISFPTVVDRRNRHYKVVLPESFVQRVIETQQM